MTVIAQNVATSEAAEKTRALLADLWRRNHTVIEERLATLDRAAAANPLPSDLQAAALDVAHKLAGSLGMFGFDHGTILARELEQLLDTSNVDTARLAELARELRDTLLPAS